MLTLFHANEFHNKIDNLTPGLAHVDQALKTQMKAQVDEFVNTLFEVSGFDPSEFEISTKFQT